MSTVIIFAFFSAMFLASKPLYLWNASLGIFYLIMVIVLAFNEGKKRTGVVKILSESELEVGKVYKKKGEMFFDDRYIQWGNGDVGIVKGGKYITLLEDADGNPLVVSLKQQAYSVFKVTDDKNNPYVYCGKKVIVE